MADLFGSKKWKKRTLTALSAALAASLTFGVLAACKKAPEEESEKTPAAPTDTQLLKNGNFEFYSDNNLTDVSKKYGLINSPNSWSFTSGSPSSDTASGIIDTEDWAYYTRTGGYPFKTFTKGEGDSAKEVTTFETIAEAYAHWEDENVSAYDRLRFFDAFETEVNALSDDSPEKILFDKYDYNVDFDDVKDLASDFSNGVSLRAGAKEGETSVLMIHNSRLSDNVLGTAQYYTSSTTITLSAGTSAKLSLFVRTDKLKHYEDTDLSARGGAYIGVTNTVGGTTLEQMQIYNINTNGEWREYTLYVRASTFATSTFKIVLGLGQGSSDDRYFAVNGYAFFDDLTCEIISNAQYEEAVLDGESVKNGVLACSVDSTRDEKQFDSDSHSERTFALDLYAGFTENDFLTDEAKIGLTEEKSGSKLYTSQNIDPSLFDDEAQNYTKITTVEELSSSDNVYVKNVYREDFDGKFPFENDRLVMLLSGNGAAYTATLKSDLFTLKPDERLLISFFVKTNKILSGLTGASAAVVNGDTKTEISAFDSTTLAGVDIDSKSSDPEKKDIYKGWAQCFFFLENDTEEDQSFEIELSFGPKEITSTTKFSYGDGYAAFANFETKSLTKTEYSYASTGDRAKKVSLNSSSAANKRFDSVSVTDEKSIEHSPALPANFRGVLGGSDFVQKNDESVPNEKPVSITSGLLSYEYAENYFASEESWRKDALKGSAETAEEWWKEIFGDARQPLMIVNGEDNVTYGYFAESATVSSSSYQRIGLRVRAPEGVKAFVYLTETETDNTGKSISPDLPAYTYWYDDDGNICRIDPSDDSFDEKNDILFELQPNGLYKRSGDDTFYANLSAFDEDDDKNKVTKAGEIVFYYKDDVYYADRTEKDNGEFEYSTPVYPLPAQSLRYDYSDRSKLPVAEMEIEGTGEWVDVNFYLRTGSEGKSYRVEVWNGSRDGKVRNSKNSYVLFDNYTSASASSNYSDLLNLSISSVKERLNEGKDVSAKDYLGDDDPLPQSESDFYRALYYTFTFFDSNSYVRYDETKDEEDLGNPWGSFKQSDYEEQLVFLSLMEEGSCTYFLDYSAIDVTVTPDDLSSDDDHEHEESSSTQTAGDMNIWLLISSGILAVVLLAVIVLVIVRRIVEDRSKKTRIKPAKDKRIRKKREE